jgi:hypothetical protein
MSLRGGRGGGSLPMSVGMNIIHLECVTGRRRIPIQLPYRILANVDYLNAIRRH